MKKKRKHEKSKKRKKGKTKPYISIEHRLAMFDSGQFLPRPISSQANFFLGQFPLRPILLWTSSTWANCVLNVCAFFVWVCCVVCACVAVRCWRGALIPFLERGEFDSSQKKRFFFCFFAWRCYLSFFTSDCQISRIATTTNRREGLTRLTWC